MDAPASPQYDLGILFVHGIGEQKPGQTLHATAGPWLHWLEAQGTRVHYHDTVLKPQGQSASFTDVTVETPGRPHTRIRLAESCWAGTFDAPAPWEFARWLYSYGGAVLTRQFTDWFIELVYRVPKWLRGERPLDTAFRIVMGFAIGGTTIVIVPIFQSIVLLLALAAAIPFLKIRETASTILIRLASILGDASAFCAWKLDHEAMASRVRHDLATLEAQCARTIIAAHSQGAAVSIDGGLRDARRDTLLVTYGAGWRKLAELRGDRLHLLRLYCAFSLPIVSAALVLWNLNAGNALMLLGLLTYIAWPALIGNESMDRAAKLDSEVWQSIEERLARGLRWVDMPATLDPVPAGLLVRTERRDQRVHHGRSISWTGIKHFETRFVVNQENPLTDHTSYWDSPDFLRQFTTVLAGQTAASLCPAEALHDSTLAYRYRRLRCWIRNLAHLALYTLATILYIRADQEVRQVMPFIIPKVGDWLKTIFDGAQSFAPPVAWFLGACLMVAIVVAWTQLVAAPLWDLWDRRAELPLPPARGRRVLAALNQVIAVLLYALAIAAPAYILEKGVAAAAIGASASTMLDLTEGSLRFVATVLLCAMALLAVAGVIGILAEKFGLLDRDTA